MTSKQAEQANTSDQGSWSGKMSPEHFPVTKEQTSSRSCRKSSASQTKQPIFLNLRKASGGGLDALWATVSPSLGELLMPNTGECPREESVSTLSQILEETPHPKYCLSEKACLGILRRAEKRGKELPEILRKALVAQAKRMSTVMTSATDEE